MRTLLLASCAAFAACAPPPHVDALHAAAPSAIAYDDAERGRALFAHNWVVGDEWSVAGDGLGPHFNATSCVACHGQGGMGGSGASHQNVNPFPRELVDGGVKGGSGGTKATRLERRAEDRQIAMQAFAQLGLQSDTGSVFGRARAVGPRNSTALFGAGLIDAIPDDVIVAAAEEQAATSKHATGRVSRTADGRVGRFGWKADVPLLSEFVARACAVEIGLDVPGVPQGGDQATEQVAPGLDLPLDDVEALTAFVATLPAPTRAPHSLASRAGERIFEDVGCVECHAQKLGDVDGIYSDLLLHDLGGSLADGAGSWGAPVTSDVAAEWRTPPLWGVRDSGPWLHDGRAQTIDAAIAAHAGEAQSSMMRWRALQQSERFALRAFLETLVAPGTI